MNALERVCDILPAEYSEEVSLVVIYNQALQLKKYLKAVYYKV